MPPVLLLDLSEELRKLLVACFLCVRGILNGRFGALERVI